MRWLTLVFIIMISLRTTSPAEQQPRKDNTEEIRCAKVLVLLGEWFGDAWFDLETELTALGWEFRKIGPDAEYRGCYKKERKVLLKTDILISGFTDFARYDALIIPSGPQFRKFNENPAVLQFVRDAHEQGLLVASFCTGNFVVKAAGLVDFPPGPELFPAEVKKVKEGIILGPRGGGPPPGDGYKSAPVKAICAAVAAELRQIESPAQARTAQTLGDELFSALEEKALDRVRIMIASHPMLLKAKNSRGETALLTAIRTDQPQAVKLLLNQGADPSAADRYGFGPLHRAAQNDNMEMANLLLSVKAPVDAVIMEGYYGYTSMAFAIQNGNLTMVKRLHEAGADIRHATIYKENYLHFAVVFNKTDIMEHLLACGLDINAPKTGGLTPLHLAAITGRREAADLLIRKGARLEALSLDGGTPLHFARAGGNPDIAELLIHSGAKDQPRNFPVYQGRYLGQKGPGKEPRPFVPELFHDIYRSYGAPVFSPDGKELFFYGYFMPWIGYSRIWWMRQENGRWSAPELAPFSDQSSWSPAFSPDGQTVYFASQRSQDNNSPPATDLWFSQKQNGKWGPARRLPSPPNRDDHNEMLPSIAADGSIYFLAFGPKSRGTRLFRSSFIDNHFSAPISLDDLIEQKRADPSPGVDELILYRYAAERYAEISICFHRPDGTWTPAVFLGDTVHRGHGTNAGLISPDRQYFFFCQNITPHWVDASFIEDLRQEALNIEKHTIRKR